MNECSRAGYLMCTTSDCCREELRAGDIAERIITEKDECIAAANAFQRSVQPSITTFTNLDDNSLQFANFLGPGDFGPSQYVA